MEGNADKFGVWIGMNKRGGRYMDTAKTPNNRQDAG